MVLLIVCSQLVMKQTWNYWYTLVLTNILKILKKFQITDSDNNKF